MATKHAAQVFLKLKQIANEKVIASEVCKKRINACYKVIHHEGVKTLLCR